MIANQVVHPSYISLEWALQYYQMIPESVPHLTSITTTRRTEFVFKNRLFIYHFIQPIVYLSTTLFSPRFSPVTYKKIMNLNQFLLLILKKPSSIKYIYSSGKKNSLSIGSENSASRILKNSTL